MPQSKKTKKIELNTQFLRALDLMEHSSKHLFITGKAGTGKSTLLNHFRLTTSKRVVVLAPTGVAALNVRGQTIHSFFKFKPAITRDSVKHKKKIKDPGLYRGIDTIIIDEISMVRADLLDCVDTFLRMHGPTRHAAFGGIQMVFIGDLYQLPPVVTSDETKIFLEHYPSPYFFDAQVFQKEHQMTFTDEEAFHLEYIELEKIYRQRDARFVGLLNAIRNDSATDEDMAALNERFSPNAEPKRDNFFVTLTTTNQMAETINDRYLAKLTTPRFSFEGRTGGSFEQKYLPTQVDLHLRAGAQVMFLINDNQGRWVNGTIGKVVKKEQVEGDCDRVIVELADGQEVEVLPYTWEIFDTTFNAYQGSLETQVVGSFTQYPLKLAWAVTIHKSQGKTFDQVIIDIGYGTFAHGQLYVALSRATSLEGIVLKRPLEKRHIIMDPRVTAFMKQYQFASTEIAN